MTKLWVVRTAGVSRVLPVAAIISVLTAPEIASAASGAHGEHAGISSIFWPWMNFLLYSAILFVLLRKAIVSGWRARTEGIKKSASSGAAELEEAVAVLVKLREREKNLSAEQKEISDRIASDKERESLQILEEGKRSAELIKRQTDDLVAAERKQAEVAVRRAMGNQIIELATSKLKLAHTADEDRKVRAAQSSKIKVLRGEGVA